MTIGHVKASDSDTLLIHPTLFGDVSLDHGRMCLAGPKGSQRLTASEYRVIVSLLNHTSWRASAAQISVEARDAECADDLGALLKSIERVNHALRVVSDRIAVSRAVGWITLDVDNLH